VLLRLPCRHLDLTILRQPDCGASPEGQVLVVSNNVYEADKEDARKPKDMRRFVARMKEMISFSPDIVLVQEVRARAVANVKEFLAKKFGCRFSIAANAGKTPWKWTKKYTHLLGRDPAVIANSDTMRVRQAGHIVTGYKGSEAVPGASIKSKRAAWVRVKERNDPNESEKPIRLVAASVHFPRGSDFKNAATSERVKKRSSEKIARKLENILHDGTAEDAKFHVIAGDFNSHRFSGSPSNEMPAYHLLTHEPYNFTDGVIQHATGGSPNPIDFIFSTGKSLDANVDSGNTHDESSSNFYSNHDLRWSLLAPY
jgi:endonuclease/exonuclease/phosphatase family metal-dependent hydrolase